MTVLSSIPRRHLLALLSGAAVVPSAVAKPAAPSLAVCRVANAAMAIEFDDRLRSRVLSRRQGATRALTAFDVSDSLRLAAGAVDFFRFRNHVQEPVRDRLGAGIRHRIVGVSAEGIEKTVVLTLYERHPGFALQTVTYRNGAGKPLKVVGWSNDAHTMEGAAGGLWSWCGSSHEDRRDWVRPVVSKFREANFMGMNASDYGSGTPIVDVWRRDAGLAVGHVAAVPKPVSLPLIATAFGGAAVAVDMDRETTLPPGGRLTTLETFVAVHDGDFFATLNGYREIMSARGLAPASPPPGAYESVWCAWGYERDVTVAEISGNLSKAADLGLKWAVIDDGWQAAIGDWRPDPKKYPRGEDDIKALVAAVKAAGLKPKLWIAPLAAAPGSDLLHDHADMLLRDETGAPRPISWWNSFYLCPAYPPTLDYFRRVMTKIVGDWGFEGVKIDGQHLNGVAPCYNPAHHHADPYESAERLQDFLKNLYETVHAVNPEAVVEFCPCGDCYAYYNLPAVDQAPASDPESSWQVRLKGKSLKALMGPSAAYAGDHVELSDGGDDFASSLGLGAVVATKFTWPNEGRASDGRSTRLTPEREQIWRKWIGLYDKLLLPLGVYRGELYDIGFDKPETHVVEKNGRFYYAFYAENWRGTVALRGLRPGRYAVRDYVEDRPLGIVSPDRPNLAVAFRRALLIEAVPVA
jgi:alpha-galactosidase